MDTADQLFLGGLVVGILALFIWNFLGIPVENQAQALFITAGLLMIPAAFFYAKSRKE